MNRRFSALCVTLVGAVIASGCGGSDSSSRTRNNALVGGDAASSFSCYASDDQRSVDVAYSKSYWDDEITKLEQDLAATTALVIPQKVEVVLPSRDEFPDEAAYEEELSKRQAAANEVNAAVDAQSKSQAEQIAQMTSAVEATKGLRQKELDRIESTQLCVGDPGTGAAGGSSGDQTTPSQPCATSSSADVSPDQDNGDRRFLSIRVCDQATKVSVQNYDVSGNSLAAGEQTLGEGTNRVLKQSISAVKPATIMFEVVTCTSNGYLDTSLITVDDNGSVTQVTVEDKSTPNEAAVIAFCGGTSTTNEGGEATSSDNSGSGGDSTTDTASNLLPTNDDGTLTTEAVASLRAACMTTEALDVKEYYEGDGKFSADELLVGKAALSCQTITTPQLMRIDMFLDASNVAEDKTLQLGNGDQSKATLGKVLFQLTEGTWSVNATFTLVFRLTDGRFQMVNVILPSVTINIGANGSDVARCGPNTFALSAPQAGVKSLTATCDSVRFGLTATSTPFSEVGDGIGGNSATFPLEHKIGNRMLVHRVESGITLSDFTTVLISCDEACVSATLDPSVSLSRSGDTVNLKATDRCAAKGPNLGMKVVVTPFLETQPDLLALQSYDPTWVMGYSSFPAPAFESQFGRTSLKTGAPWYWVTSYCHSKDTSTDGPIFTDWQSAMVKLSDTPDAPQEETVADVSTMPVPAVPVANVVSDGALVMNKGVTSVAVSVADVKALLDALDMPDAQVSVGFDDSAPTPLSYTTTNRLLIPEKAKVLTVSIASADGVVKVSEYPIVQAHVVDVTTEGVAQSAGGSDSNNFWLYVLGVVTLTLLVAIVSRKLRATTREPDNNSKI